MTRSKKQRSHKIMMIISTVAVLLTYLLFKIIQNYMNELKQALKRLFISDFAEVNARVDGLQSSINSLPTAQAVDLSSITAEIEALKAQIANINPVQAVVNELNS